MKILLYFLEMGIVFIVSSFFLMSANHVKKIEINPLNRTTIYCTDIPGDFKSELSEDKLKISITLPNSTIEDEARKVDGNGIITDVYAQKQDTALTIMIMLKDKRGYTAALLPYTKAIIIETFDWKKLSKEEDHYRSGLLAYEEGVFPSAKDHLEKAMLGNIPDVGVYLGIVYLKAGDLNKAMESLITARSSGTKLVDVYAGLAQIYSMKGDNDKAKHYRELFKKQTGLAYFPYLDIADSLKLDIPKEDQYSLLSQSDASNENNDTLESKSEKENTSKPVIAQDSAITKPRDGFSEPSLFIYSVIAAILLLIVVLTSYLKWRKKQLKNTKQTKNNDFNQDLDKAKKSLPPTSHVAKKYKENAEISKSKAQKAISQKPKQVSTKEKPDPGKELEKIAKKLKQDQENNERVTLEDKIEKNTEDIKNNSKINAKLELAMHLQKEQQKLKRKNLETLKESVKPNDIEKLSDVAKKLGIEKGMVEADKQIRKLSSDKDSISKLADKFKKNK